MAVRSKKRKASRSRAPRPGGATLRDRNLAAFRKYAPGIHTALAAHQPRSQLVPAGRDEVNIQRPEGPLYGGFGAASYTARRLRRYWRRTTRFASKLLETENLKREEKDFTERLLARSAEAGIGFGEVLCNPEAYFTVSMGIGLGLHLPELIERTQCESLILVDTDFDHLYHSTFVLDWTPILKRFRGRRRIDFMFCDRAEDMAAFVQNVVKEVNIYGLDGLYWFSLFENEACAGAMDHFRNSMIQDLVLRQGFFQDEYNMLLQSYENLRDCATHVLTEKYPNAECPAIVVGNGPSLDSSLGAIKQIQDKALIIACGSAVDPLLKHGIQPDFLVIIEPDPALLKYHALTQQQHDLSGVCLVAASNVFPPLRDYHDHSILFFRPSLTPRSIFAREDGQVLMKSDPVVANTGLAFAGRLGCGEVYLAGVDMGTRDPDYHHSKDSVYETTGLVFPEKFDVPVPGNGGGTVYTTTTLAHSRWLMEMHIEESPADWKFYNLGDGALIAGTTTTSPDQVSSALASYPSLDKRRLVEEIVRESPVYTEGKFRQAWSRAGVADAVESFCKRSAGLFRRRNALAPAFVTSFLKLLTHKDIIKDPAALFLRGTLGTCFYTAVFYDGRVPAGEQRAEFRRIAAEELAALTETMRLEARDLLEYLEEGRKSARVSCRLEKRAEIAGSPIV